MPILFCSLELFLPYSHSLKDKRRVMRGTADRLRSRFNFSISEIGYQELWQRGRLGAVSIGPDRMTLERLADQFRRECERTLGGELVEFSVQMIEFE
ncbi:MAG TPA: DUF503 domain-containing protein [Acidobacteriota bacterium]|nr:DUF503 domain-containing protein [Acidobacteriota bacterium]